MDTTQERPDRLRAVLYHTNEVSAMRYLRPILLSLGIGIGVGVLTHPIMAILTALVMAPVFILLDGIVFRTVDPDSDIT